MADENLFSATRYFEWNLSNVTLQSLIKYTGSDDNKILKTEEFEIWLGNIVTKWDFIAFYQNSSLALLFRKKHLGAEHFKVNCVINTGGSDNYNLFKVETTSKEIGVRGGGWEKFINIHTLFETWQRHIKPNSLLNLKIEFKLTEMQTPVVNQVPVQLNLINTRKRDAYGDFVSDKTFSDFTFKCSDEVNVPVHRVVLAGKSTVFKNMFTVDMVEKRKKTATLPDIDSATLKKVLSFMYTDSTDQMSLEMIKNVLYAAEKYELSNLSSHCCQVLNQMLSQQNVCEVLKIADLHSIKELETKCLRMIIM